MRVHKETIAISKQEALKASVEHRINEVLKEVEPDTLREVMNYASFGGKMVRPLLALLSCSTVGGKERDALNAAASLELLHISSLIHDDIMDSSPLRRGRPTVHMKFGIPLAILAGDAFIAIAFQMINDITSPNKDRILKIFTESFRHVCEGQGYDLALTGKHDACHHLHRNMVEKKTAKLLEAAAAIGALCGTINNDHVEMLARFGYHLGMAFQAQDDLLDATGDAQRMGKPVALDAMNGRGTYLSLVYSSRNSSRRLSDAVAETTNVVEEYTMQACAALAVLPSSESQELLLRLAKSLVHRKE